MNCDLTGRENLPRVEVMSLTRPNQEYEGYKCRDNSPQECLIWEGGTRCRISSRTVVELLL
jgi:hypothetical protein